MNLLLELLNTAIFGKLLVIVLILCHGCVLNSSSTLQSQGNRLQCVSLLNERAQKRQNNTQAKVNVFSRHCLADASRRKMKCFILTWTSTDKELLKEGRGDVSITILYCPHLFFRRVVDQYYYHLPLQLSFYSNVILS